MSFYVVSQTSSNVSKFKFRKERVRMMSSIEEMNDKIDCIVYWMNRDQRVQGDSNIDNLISTCDFNLFFHGKTNVEK